MYNVMFWGSPLLVILAGIVAYYEGNYSKVQQLARGIANGLPFTQHLGMWSDLAILPFVLGTMWKYCDQWTVLPTLICILLSLAITVAMHFSWIKGAKSQEHILGPDGMTWSGWLHVVYMTMVLAMIFLFYFTGLHKAPGDELFVAILLAMHVLIGSVGVSFVKSGKADAGSMITTGVCWAALACAVIW